MLTLSSRSKLKRKKSTFSTFSNTHFVLFTRFNRKCREKGNQEEPFTPARTQTNRTNTLHHISTFPMDFSSCQYRGPEQQQKLVFAGTNEVIYLFTKQFWLKHSIETKLVQAKQIRFLFFFWKKENQAQNIPQRRKPQATGTPYKLPH
jgi:hypothetical protein